MTSRRIPIADSGEILVRKEEKIPLCNNYDEFQERLKKYIEEEHEIIKNIPWSVTNNSMQEVFNELVRSFKGKETFISNCLVNLDEKIEKIKLEIPQKEVEGQPKIYSIELNKLQLSKLQTFRWLILKEKKRVGINKQDALRAFMAQCVNNELARNLNNE